MGDAFNPQVAQMAGEPARPYAEKRVNKFNKLTAASDNPIYVSAEFFRMKRPKQFAFYAMNEF